MSNNKVAKLRGFTSARSLSLYSNDIKNDIYDNLINGIKNNLPKFYKYYDLKKKVLGLEKIHIYDTYANITKIIQMTVIVYLSTDFISSFCFESITNPPL